MPIKYCEIDSYLLEKIFVEYGEIAQKHIHTEGDGYSLAAVLDDAVIGFISTYTRYLAAPIEEEKDAYIDIIEVNKKYHRLGIGAELVSRAEAWAQKAGLIQLTPYILSTTALRKKTLRRFRKNYRRRLSYVNSCFHASGIYAR